MTNGWGGLDDVNNRAVQAVTLSDDDIVIAKIFKGEQGDKALKALARITVEKPSFQSMYPDGINTAIGMAMREGENNLYRRILSIIKKVDNVGSK
jgi:hypothetical protein